MFFHCYSGYKNAPQCHIAYIVSFNDVQGHQEYQVCVLFPDDFSVTTCATADLHTVNVAHTHIVEYGRYWIPTWFGFFRLNLSGSEHFFTRSLFTVSQFIFTIYQIKYLTKFLRNGRMSEVTRLLK